MKLFPMKTAAYAALAIAVAVQIVFEAFDFTKVPHDMAWWYRQIITVGFVALLLRAKEWTWISLVLRVLLGLDFGLAVSDRFGVFGAYGHPGVSWGDFGHFIAYTRQVNSFLPATFAPALAVAATIVEIALAVTLIAGIRVRFACYSASFLLLTYAAAMTASFGFTSQLYYAVTELCAGAWLLAGINAGVSNLRHAGNSQRASNTGLESSPNTL